MTVTRLRITIRTMKPILLEILLYVQVEGKREGGVLQVVPSENKVENKVVPTFNELFCNQQSLWKDNNRLMRYFMEFMKKKN